MALCRSVPVYVLPIIFGLFFFSVCNFQVILFSSFHWLVLANYIAQLLWILNFFSPPFFIFVPLISSLIACQKDYIKFLLQQSPVVNNIFVPFFSIWSSFSFKLHWFPLPVLSLWENNLICEMLLQTEWNCQKYLRPAIVSFIMCFFFLIFLDF